MSDSRRFTIKIEGSVINEHTVPFRLLAEVLNGIQKTFYYVALAEIKKEGNVRGRIPHDIQQACELRRVLEKPGRYEMVAEIADVSGPNLFPGMDLGKITLDKYLGMIDYLSSPDDMVSLETIFPDSFHRRRILRSVETYCPKEGDEWQLSFRNGHGSKPLILNKNTRHRINVALVKPQEESRVITGELIRLHLDEHKIGISYPPTGRVLECFYDPEIEELVIENLKGYVQVTGRVQLDASGQPDKIVDARDIFELDLSPIRLSRLGDSNFTFVLNKLIYLEPQFNASDQEVVIELPEFNIITEGSTREQVIKNFEADFIWLWKEYALADDAILSPDAVALKNALLDLVKEAYDGSAET